VDAHPAGASAFGVFDLLGNGWEWTSTPFGPLPGFQPFPFYPGYSADFFDGKHFVMKGGSPRTDACMLRRSFRNWFQPHYPYVYATFRCMED
jgi:formylglycine-generating enzyme required for sulfatase activity